MAGVSDVAKAGGVNEDAVRGVVAGILALTKSGQDVRIQNFGTFSKQHKDAYTGRNPGTGEPVDVPAKDVLKFKPTSGLDMSVPKPVGGGRRR